MTLCTWEGGCSYSDQWNYSERVYVIKCNTEGYNITPVSSSRAAFLSQQRSQYYVPVLYHKDTRQGKMLDNRLIKIATCCYDHLIIMYTLDYHCLRYSASAVQLAIYNVSHYNYTNLTHYMYMYIHIPPDINLSEQFPNLSGIYHSHSRGSRTYSSSTRSYSYDDIHVAASLCILIHTASTVQ